MLFSKSFCSSKLSKTDIFFDAVILLWNLSEASDAAHKIVHKKNLIEILMKHTILYTNAFLAANKNYKVKSISHITGGGLIDNPPRAFNENLTLKFDMKNFKLPPLFKWLKDKSNISLFELTKTFNCGIGFLIFVDKNDAQEIINDINKIGYNAFVIGSMIENNYEKNVVFDGWNF